MVTATDSTWYQVLARNLNHQWQALLEALGQLPPLQCGGTTNDTPGKKFPAQGNEHSSQIKLSKKDGTDSES